MAASLYLYRPGVSKSIFSCIGFKFSMQQYEVLAIYNMAVELTKPKCMTEKYEFYQAYRIAASNKF